MLAFAHPFFSVTDETGAFRIPNLSVGEHQVTVWHDTLETFQQTVTVSAQGETSITLEYPNHADARKIKPSWLSRPRAMWQGSLRLRLSVGMAVMITLGMALFATLRLIEIQRVVKMPPHRRARWRSVGRSP